MRLFTCLCGREEARSSAAVNDWRRGPASARGRGGDAGAGRGGAGRGGEAAARAQGLHVEA